MSTAVMMERIAEASPRFKARIAGAFYLLIFVAAPFAEFFVRGRLVVDGDAAATATNILAHESLFRLGFVAELFTLLCDTTVALILYDLLKPVNRSLSLLAAFFRLMLVAIMAVDSLNYFSPLVLLGGAHFLTAFKADQLQALALVSQSLYTHGYNISLVFFGFHCLVIGYLIYRSTFLPRIIGVLLAIGGPCYVANSLGSFLSPGFAAPYLLIPAALGELSLTLWLLVVGVNVPKWEEKASAWRASGA